MSDNPDVSPEQHARKAKLRGLTLATMVLMLATVLVSLGAVAYLSLKSADQSEQNYRAIKGIEAVNERLVDCTEPGGKCFEAGTKRTGEAVVGINEGTLRVIVAALSCQADGITGQRELARCTAKRAEATPDQPGDS